MFVVGSKGIPGNYGGYETFADRLTEYHQSVPLLKYHVACKAKDSKTFKYHNADCFNVKVPDIGPAQAIYYDVAALQHCVNYTARIASRIRLFMFSHAASDRSQPTSIA